MLGRNISKLLKIVYDLWKSNFVRVNAPNGVALSIQVIMFSDEQSAKAGIKISCTFFVGRQ